MTLNNFAGSPIHPSALRASLCTLLGCCLFLACAAAQAEWFNPLKLFSSDDDELVVWQGPGQYVKIVDQDRFDKYARAPKNNHPTTISARDFAVVLASLQVRKEEGAGSGALFTPTEIAAIAPKLSDAFSRANPTQDVIFAVADAQGKSGRLTTAARLFVNEGALNILLGDTLQPGGTGAELAINHREAPFRPGRRRETMETSHGVAGGPGIGFLPGYRSPRYDWVIVDVPTTVAAYKGPPIPLAVAPVAPLAPDAAGVPAAGIPAAGGTPEDNAKLLQERQQMREEMARMKKQLDDQSAGAAPAAGPAAPQSSGGGAIPAGTRAAETKAVSGGSAPAAAGKGGAGSEAVEKRLSILQSLHEKKLITDEEFAAKRKAILEDL